jgi:hypothetical protein
MVDILYLIGTMALLSKVCIGVLYVTFIIALKAVYPEHSEVFTGIRKSKGYWNDTSNQRAFFDQLAVSLNITKPEDWFSPRIAATIRQKASFVNNRYGGSLLKGNDVT